MDYQFPKRILEEGAETNIDKINNTCRRTILGTLKVVLRDEYQEVLKDPFFGPILEIVENKLIYSGKIIHSFICQHLKFKEELDVDFNNWKSDKGFWSTVLKENRKTNLLIIRDELLKGEASVFGIGELPAHERTRLMWDLDVTHMYVPLNVGKHWISMCVNFVSRSIEVFDCEGLKHNKEVEPFAFLIPRIVKVVQSSKSRQQLKSSSDCGVYALKHIECHLLGLDFYLVNDNNIREASQKIAYDLWEAANDPELSLRMAQYTPPKTITNPLVELD
uniref:Ubiquitin-like protease family profile domain-containing protein n=1 Tax=Brassica oleracea TaxID=3712 RepID=A0A3P6E392_BRAOL|nr:unnamed protein product [Brassica oleracea]